VEVFDPASTGGPCHTDKTFNRCINTVSVGHNSDLWANVVFKWWNTGTEGSIPNWGMDECM
jgi:hypothetical protein